MKGTPTANIERDLTQDHFSATWIGNIAENMRRSGIQDLETIHNFLNVERAIICGTGPTLNNQLVQLADISKHEPETIIISNHSNTATLLYMGAVPDLVVIADSQDPTLLRMKRDVIPNFKSALRRKHTAFVLPTHANPALVKLLLDNNLPVYFYNAIMREDPEDNFRTIYNQIVRRLTENVIKTFCLMVGSVSNASVLICNALKLLNRADSLEDVILTGVDYSYPNGVTRCMQVTWNADAREFDVEERPTFLGEEIKIVKYNGLETSEDQIAYYKDLRFIYWNMIESAKDDAPFRLSTVEPNFIADFLPVQAL